MSLLIRAATDRGTDVVILLYLHEISKKAFSGSMLGINTVSHIETAPCYVSSFRCQLCHLDVGESRESDPSQKGWELSLIQQPSSNLPLCSGSVLSAVQGATPGNTPGGVLEEDIRCSDFLFLLIFQNRKPSYLFLVSFWGLGFLV